MKTLSAVIRHQKIERGSLQMKNYLRIIALVVVAVLLFGLGFGLGQKSGITVTLDEKAVAALGGNGGGSASVSTNPPATNPPATEPPATNPPADVTPDEPTPDTPADEPANDNPAADAGKVPASTAEVVKAYNDAIAKAKATQNMTVHKISNVDIRVTDCSIKFALPLINPIVQKFVTGSDDTWTFAGSGTGTNANGDTVDADKLIPPGRRAAALAESHVSSATATPAGDGYTMTIVLNNEKSTFDGTNTVEPVANNAVVDALNLATMDISPATISAAEMTYSGTALTATVDGQGRLTELTVKIPMSGTGQGGVGRFNGLTLTLEGELNDSYAFTY